MKPTPLKVVVTGATGAVGSQVVRTLLELPQLEQLTLLGRRPLGIATGEAVRQHTVDVTSPTSYATFLPGHDQAICTLGVGQPSKVSREQFLKIDKAAPLDFARAAKNAGIRHFSLLASVGIDADSRSFYLRSKGELVEEINALGFERFSVFQPSMILTPENRYGWSQGVLLTVWPWLNPLLSGGLKKYRGVRVEDLGAAMARNLLRDAEGVEYLSWTDFRAI